MATDNTMGAGSPAALSAAVTNIWEVLWTRYIARHSSDWCAHQFAGRRPWSRTARTRWSG